MSRVITAMRENLGETLTIDDMARAAMYSKFHFSRAFQRVTGVSPGRFLSAMRLQEAKRLLVTTSLSVTEISHRVGYSSVGTFGSRFCSTVGVSPTTYRRLGGYCSKIVTDDRRPVRVDHTVTLRGTVHSSSPEYESSVFIGLFREPIPQGRPLRCAVLDAPGAFELADVPQGTWYVLAQSVMTDPAEQTDGGQDGQVSVGSHGPITVRPGQPIHTVDIALRPLRQLDPPVLMALLDARTPR
ncbi:AraC-like DNA-binding protein [Actinoalloteichus hoggarensis]|uniref:AraC family transcriptional regulator n=1 Tax=Actinoalloteichus hoggarensis TaxID=1470176 RepID=UPI00183CCDA4|nr:AraC family transcriptional regulator [Actinoalloteichus hoggarensis]MBB5920876.1 AraC-like DNA-binding protein [Actinoalloteichus hoggarensis]